MDDLNILKILNGSYPLRFDSSELIRDVGSTAYAVYADGKKYFLRVTKSAFIDTAVKAVDIHMFLLGRGFPVTPVVLASDGAPYVRDGERLYILHEFIEGDEADPERDAEALGELTGRLHREMREYPAPLVPRRRHFYVGRYIDILRKKRCPQADEFAALGNELWEKVDRLPTGYCHGDMYRGNFHKTSDGRLYVLDFDTSSNGLPMYDPALICNMTDYFRLGEDGYERSRRVFERFLPEYLKYVRLTKDEISAFEDLIALYHFALQATIIELFGEGCVDNAFFDRQLKWLYGWREQCARNKE